MTVTRVTKIILSTFLDMLMVFAPIVAIVLIADVETLTPITRYLIILGLVLGGVRLEQRRTQYLERLGR